MFKVFLTAVSFVVMSTAAFSAMAADTHSDKERKEGRGRFRALGFRDKIVTMITSSLLCVLSVLCGLKINNRN